MSLHFEKIPLSEFSSFIIREFKTGCLDYPMHVHHQYELNIVFESYGKRIIGDNVGNFGPGDLVFLAPDIPHQWYNEGIYKRKDVHNIVLQIQPSFFDNAFWEKEEMQVIKKLLKRAQRGILYNKNMFEKIKNNMKALIEKRGFDAVLEMLIILNMLANTNDYSLLASMGYQHKQVSGKSIDRINKVFQYIMEHYQDQVYLENAASLIHMEKSAFCRFFKNKTGKNFTQFITELRLGHASRLLIETGKNISQIAYESGFNNLSFFNRKFRDIYHYSPTEYKQFYKK